MGNAKFILDGSQIKSIYVDSDASLLKDFKLESVERASLVEPSPADPHYWIVDFSPQGGDIFYADDSGDKFKSRAQALEFEKQRLHRFLAGDATAICVEAGQC